MQDVAVRVLQIDFPVTRGKKIFFVRATNTGDEAGARRVQFAQLRAAGRNVLPLCSLAPRRRLSAIPGAQSALSSSLSPRLPSNRLHFHSLWPQSYLRWHAVIVHSFILSIQHLSCISLSLFLLVQRLLFLARLALLNHTCWALKRPGVAEQNDTAWGPRQMLYTDTL